MARALPIVLGLVSLTAVNATARLPKRDSSVLVISLPGVPNPPEQDRYARRLFRGTPRWVDNAGKPTSIDPVPTLSEAALSCGQGRLQWRGLDYDHGNELLLANDLAARRALACVARKVPFDFYARVEGINVR